MLSPQRTWSFAQYHIMDGYGWHLCFCTDPRFHKAIAVPCFPPAGHFRNFRIFDWSNPKRISDTDLTGISRDFCKPAAAALQATVLLQEVHDSNTCDMQMSKKDRCKLTVQCNVIFSSLRKRRVQASEPELQEVTSGFSPGILAQLMGNRVIMPFLVHLTKVTKICQIYQLYAQLGHCSVIHRKHTCQARDKGSSSTPYQ